MVGQMACRFTWLSGLLFDEYRKRQTAEGFTWGTEVPACLQSSFITGLSSSSTTLSIAPTRQPTDNRGAGGGRGDNVHDHSVLQEGICACSGTEAFVPTGTGATWNIMHHLWERASCQRTLGQRRRHGSSSDDTADPGQRAAVCSSSGRLRPPV